MRKQPAFSLTLILLCSLSGHAAGADEVPYGVGDWPESFGNHRARIRVAEKADAVWVHIPWRRRDANPENKEIIVVDAATNKRVDNVLRVNINRESGDLLFQPATAPGEYYVYYMPYKTFRPWLLPDRHLHGADATRPTRLGRRPASRLAKRIAAGDIAGHSRRQGAGNPGDQRVPPLRSDGGRRHRGRDEEAAGGARGQALPAVSRRPPLPDPHDRRIAAALDPGRAERCVPRRRRTAASSTCSRLACMRRGKDLKNVRVSFTPLNVRAGIRFPPRRMRCFNTGGTDWLGRTFAKTVTWPRAGCSRCGSACRCPRTPLRACIKAR